MKAILVTQFLIKFALIGAMSIVVDETFFVRKASAAALTAQAKIGTVTFNKAAANNPDAKGLEIVLEKLTRFDVGINGGTGVGVTSMGDVNGNLVVRFSFPNALPDKSSSRFSIRATDVGLAKKVKFKVQSGFWLDSNDNPIVQTQVTGAALVGDPIYTIFNDLIPSVDINVKDFTLFENHEPIDLDAVDPSIPIDSTGNILTDFTLTGLGSLKDFTVAPINKNKYLYVQGQLYNPSNQEILGSFIDAYSTTPIPEPSSILGIFAVGGLGLMGLGKKHLRQATGDV